MIGSVCSTQDREESQKSWGSIRQPLAYTDHTYILLFRDVAEVKLKSKQDLQTASVKK